MGNLFSVTGLKKTVLGVIHLPALSGSPEYSGSFQQVLDEALAEALIYSECGIHGVIVENYHDVPFFPGRVPAETVAGMAVAAREIKKEIRNIPLGINVLRNDALSAIAIAVASGAEFIRVNVHSGAMLTDQGIIQGQAHDTLRMRRQLHPNLHILADVLVKHAAPLVDRGIENEVSDLEERGKADGIIVSGTGTGKETDIDRLRKVKNATRLPVWIGSGITAENLSRYAEFADGFIVGTYFKKNGLIKESPDRERILRLMNALS